MSDSTTPATHQPKNVPDPSPRLLFSPQRDGSYVHFETATDYPFRPDAVGLSLTNAWWLAEAALLAYWDEGGAEGNPGAADRFTAAGLKLHALVRGDVGTGGLVWTDTQCYVAGNDRFVIVAFRGTESAQWRDAATDAVFGKVPWSDGINPGMVHRGFKKGLDVVWPRLLFAVRAAVSAGRGSSPPSVWLTGHSLGAALATLAADRLSAEGVAVAGVYTFGSPRVGDEDFARSFARRFDGRCYRFVNGADVVTRIPPPSLLLNYEHVGAEQHFDANGRWSSIARAVPPPQAAVSGPVASGLSHLPLLGAAHHHVVAAVAKVEQLRHDAAIAVSPLSLPTEVRGLVGALGHWGQTSPLPPDFVDHTPRRYAVLTWNALPACP